MSTIVSRFEIVSLKLSGELRFLVHRISIESRWHSELLPNGCSLLFGVPSSSVDVNALVPSGVDSVSSAIFIS